jgi:hypothetical protein
MQPSTHWWQQEWLWAAVGAIGVPLSILLYRRGERQEFYTQIDDMYRDILEMVVENPDLRKPLLTGEKREKYDAFAFIVWNFLETIYDRCSGNEKLMRTWRPIFRTESELHTKWFEAPENHGKFKDEFRDYVYGRRWEAPVTFRAKLLRLFR